jgi:hypothetical protein
MLLKKFGDEEGEVEYMKSTGVAVIRWCCSDVR